MIHMIQLIFGKIDDLTTYGKYAQCVYTADKFQGLYHQQLSVRIFAHATTFHTDRKHDLIFKLISVLLIMTLR